MAAEHPNYHQLLYFWAVVREGGVVKAAEALHVTPQTISGQLKLLQGSINGRLLSRVGMTLVLPCQPPTAEGYVQLRPGASGPAPLVPAQVLRAEACPGGFEVELGFLGEELSAVP